MSKGDRMRPMRVIQGKNMKNKKIKSIITDCIHFSDIRLSIRRRLGHNLYKKIS
jgi:hypothetical protein